MKIRYDFSVLETPAGSIFPLGQEGETGGPFKDRPAILDLNESGEYVGRLIQGDGTLLAFSSTGGNFNIGPVNSQAFGINDNNVVVGQRPDQFSRLGGFQTSPDGSINGASSPANGGVFDSATFDINNNGVNVGQSIGGRPYRANLDSTFIQTLTDGSGIAYDINEFNQVVGQSDSRAFFIDGNLDSQAIDLGTLREDDRGISRAFALNDFSNSAGEFIEFVGEASVDGGGTPPIRESFYDDNAFDLSGNSESPTTITLSTGNNIIAGSTAPLPEDQIDRDYFRFVVPEGSTVSGIVLDNYTWNEMENREGKSYFALKREEPFPDPTSNLSDRSFEISKLIDSSEVQKNLLEPDVGDSASENNRLGTGALGPGTYYAWYQETGADTTYAFNIILDTPAAGVTHAAYGQVIFGAEEPFFSEFVSDLGTLSSDDSNANSVAYDINRNFVSNEGEGRGKIVGSSDTDFGEKHAFVVFDDELETMFDLNDLVVEGDTDFLLPSGARAFTLLEATAINDDGVIVGTARLDTNKRIQFENGDSVNGFTDDLFGFRLTPREEPTDALVLEVGLYDTVSDTLITSIKEGTEVPAGLLAGKDVTLAAFVPENSLFSGQVESMFLDLNNGQFTRTENAEPYALFGDSPKGDFLGSSLALDGSNTISFDLYSENKLMGNLLDTVTINFTISET